MTTCVLKRDPVWLASLSVGVISAPIILLGKDDCQVAVPASLLLAASPLVRRVLTDLLPPSFSPCYMSLAVTEDVLNQVVGILSSGTAAFEHAHEVEEVQQVLFMLGIEPSLVSCDYEDIKMGHPLEEIIKMELVINEFDLNVVNEEIKLEGTDNTLEDETIADTAKKRTPRLYKNNSVVNFDNVVVKGEMESEFEEEGTLSFYRNNDVDYDNVVNKTERYLKFQCSFCQQKFTRKYNLERHIDNVHQKKSCTLCAKTFTYEQKLLQHMTAVHDIKVSCNLCPLKLDKKDLKLHRIAVHNKKIVMCPICPKQYETKSHLRQHVDYVHNKIKVPCNFCSLEFSTNSHLTRHVKSAHSKIDFPCSMCALKFTDETSLSQHMAAIHINFVQSLPSRVQVDDSSKKTFKSVHTKKDFSCSLCSKKYSRKDELLRHIQLEHLGEEPSLTCEKGF